MDYNIYATDLISGEGAGRWRSYAAYRSYAAFISKMYFSQRKPPGVSETMWSVNLDASISGEYQTLGGHPCRPSE